LPAGFLLKTLPFLEAGWRGRRFYRERLAAESAMMLAAKREQEIIGVVLGHLDGGGRETVDHLAVAAAVRGRGRGRRLLAKLESGANILGVRELTLGSTDEAVGAN
jgi:N-acetylglutamate synthase-like GNAT family acetyltransferase